MNSKVLLASVAVIISIALLLPVFADVTKDTSYARIEGFDVKIADINDSHATLKFVVHIKRSKVLENATILAKIYDLKTNILLEEISKTLPEKVKSEDSRESVLISLEKDRGYSVALSIDKEGKRLSSREFVLTGLDTIMPEEKELKVVLKDADFAVKEVGERNVKILARFYVEALKSYDVLAHVKAVQYESNILADDFWKEVRVEGGKTVIIEGNLSLPNNYNYLVKLELWRNGSLLKTWSKQLSLSPAKKIPKNVTEKEVKFEISEFVRTPAPTPRMEYAERKAAPGFELLLLLLSGGVALWRRRSS